jgi:DNA-binding transcriptional MerR regulator
MTRSQVAARLRVSISTVRRLEGSALHPQRDEHGVHVFAAADVEALSRQRAPAPAAEGEIAAAAFALFEQHEHPRKIVIALKQPPEKVRSLRAEWVRLGRELLLEADDRARLGALLGGFRSSRELVNLVQKLVSKARSRPGIHGKQPAATASQVVE